MSRALIAAMAMAVAAVALAAEPEEWGERERDHYAEMEERTEEALLGHLDAEERAEADRYWATHLRRAPMDAIESAQYAIAEIQLQQRNARAAVAALGKVLEGQPEQELASVTHFNLGEVLRREGDLEGAAKQYLDVQGHYRHHARHCLIAMLADRGNATAAAKHLEALAAKAEQKGEKLALLQQLAALYRKAGSPDLALTTYERITREFTPADLKALREEAAAEANAMVGRMRDLMAAERGDEIERQERQIHMRMRDLRLGGRRDELRAFEAIVDRAFRELEQRERDEDRRERDEDRRERDEDRRERDADRREDEMQGAHEEEDEGDWREGDRPKPKEGGEHKPPKAEDF